MLAPHALVAIAMTILFIFQMARLAAPVSAQLSSIIGSGNRTYIRSTIRKEAAAVAKNPKA